MSSAPLPSLPSDAELVAGIRRGDLVMFEAWYMAWFTPLWRFARHFVGSGDVAKDVVQDVFLSIWERRATFVIQSTAAAYLYGAVRRRALREHRHDAVVQRAEQLASAAGISWGMGETPELPDASVSGAEHRAALTRAILALPDRQRLALGLWLDHELSTAEVAEIMEVSERAVRKLLEKARNALVRVLPPEL